MKDIIPVVTKKDFEITDQIKIVENSRKFGKKISLATRVDDAFILALFNNQNNLGKFLDLEVDPGTNILTLHFMNREIEEERKLAHEMR